MSGQIESVKDAFDHLENMVLADLDGNLLASAMEVGENVNISDREYFKKVLTGSSATSRVIYSRITGDPIYVEAVPVYRNNALSGCLLALIKVSSITDMFIDKIKVGESGYAFVMEKDGPVIAYPDKSKIMKLNGNMFDFSKTILERKTGLMVYDFKGTEKVSVYKQEKELGWITVINAPTSEVFSAAVTLRNRLILMAVLTMAVIGLMVCALTQMMVVKRIRHIAGIMKDISEGEGDLTMRISNQANDEIASLVGRFKV